MKLPKKSCGITVEFRGKSTVLGRCGGGRVRPERRRQLDASSDPLALRDRVDEIGVEIAQQFAIYEELASLLWLHYAGWEDL